MLELCSLNSDDNSDFLYDQEKREKREEGRYYVNHNKIPIILNIWFSSDPKQRTHTYKTKTNIRFKCWLAWQEAGETGRSAESARNFPARRLTAANTRRRFLLRFETQKHGFLCRGAPTTTAMRHKLQLAPAYSATCASTQRCAALCRGGSRVPLAVAPATGRGEPAETTMQNPGNL